MRPLLSVEHDDGYDRYLYVQVFDKEELARARMSFARYQNQGVIRDGSFNDEVWTLTDEVHIRRLNFHIAPEEYSKGAGRWVGCGRNEFTVYMKSYVAFQLGRTVLAGLYDTVRRLKKLAAMDMDAAQRLESGNIEAEFLSFLPGVCESRDRVIESMEERSLVKRWNRHPPRQLADFRSYLRFDKALRDYWACAQDEEMEKYFPVYLWWNLTAVLPLRPTEFLLTPADCLENKDGRYVLTVKRSLMKKKGNHLVTYTIAADYNENQYEIPAALGEKIREYQRRNFSKDISAEPTLFPSGAFGRSGHMTYAQLNRLLKQFLKDELHNSIEIHLGDTRHLAMINLMLSGGSPTICKALAGHEDINVSSNYYSNLSGIIESTVYDFYRGNEPGAILDGSMFFALKAPAHGIRIQNGWCDYPAVMDGDISQCLKNYSRPGTMGDCINCSHFYPDKQGLRLKIIEDRKAAVDESTAFLIQMVEQVRKGQEKRESIASAMARLQQQSLKYMHTLHRQYEMEMKS